MGGQRAMVVVWFRGLLATSRNDSLYLLYIVEDCTVLFTQRDITKTFFFSVLVGFGLVWLPVNPGCLKANENSV